MTNKVKSLIIFSFLSLFINCSVIANDQFNFNISEINILEDGNKIVGSKRGEITTNDGVVISADSFVYNKIENNLVLKGNVIFLDKKNDYKILSEEINYNKKDEIIFTKGNTTSEIYSKYDINSKDIVFLKKEKILNSEFETTIINNQNKTLYKLKRFNFILNEELLKGHDILVNLNYNQPFNDKLFFESAILDLKNKSFIAKNIQVNLKKDLFDNLDNDPRLKGVSATSENKITKIKKGVFTSCKNDDGCPPWVITAKEITHDKNKKQLIYDGALLKVYNIPILYFPKFFHPDPTVKRQSGLLKPQLNNSNILGSSISLPYYKVISENKDFTFRPRIFDSDIKMFQNEYRQKNKNSSFVIDFAYIDDYESSLDNKKNSISHLFANFEADLNWENFTNSNFILSLKKVSNDTYLKIFNENIFKSDIIPSNHDLLTSEAKLTLDNENYNLIAGIQSFENLSLPSSDRYQFILPYYNYDREIFKEYEGGFINFSSTGSNDLNTTNNLKTTIINDINFESLDLLSSNGFKSGYNIYFKNLNTVAKNDSKYKTSPQIELMSIFELNSSLPLITKDNNTLSYLTPKASLRINPGEMKDYSSNDRSINVDGIFDINRLSIDDSFEKGKSLTLGLDYKKTSISDINKFFEAKIATVYRDKKESFIPTTSGINDKNSNIFGKISNNYLDNFELSYDFILDNDLNKLLYNSLSASLSLGNFNSKFNFVEENDAIGDTNSIENTTTLKFNDQNYLSYNTRRNRKIDLTEYYNFIYEYKNDCLVAGIKYNKTYYEDRDLKPSENILFSITLSPLTSVEQKIDQ